MFNSVWWQRTFHPMVIISIYKLTLVSQFGKERMSTKKTDSLFYEWYWNSDNRSQRCKCSCLHTHKHNRALKRLCMRHKFISFLAPTCLLHSHLPCPAQCIHFTEQYVKDRTGRDKGSTAGVFTANTVAENSCRRRKGRGLMAGAKPLDPSWCERSPQSQESMRKNASFQKHGGQWEYNKLSVYCYLFTDSHIL